MCLLLANTPNAYIKALSRLRDPERRAALGGEALDTQTPLHVGQDEQRPRLSCCECPSS